MSMESDADVLVGHVLTAANLRFTKIRTRKIEKGRRLMTKVEMHQEDVEQGTAVLKRLFDEATTTIVVHGKWVTIAAEIP